MPFELGLCSKPPVLSWNVCAAHVSHAWWCSSAAVRVCPPPLPPLQTRVCCLSDNAEQAWGRSKALAFYSARMTWPLLLQAPFTLLEELLAELPGFRGRINLCGKTLAPKKSRRQEGDTLTVFRASPVGGLIELGGGSSAHPQRAAAGWPRRPLRGCHLLRCFLLHARASESALKALQGWIASRGDSCQDTPNLSSPFAWP